MNDYGHIDDVSLTISLIKKSDLWHWNNHAEKNSYPTQITWVQPGFSFHSKNNYVSKILNVNYIHFINVIPGCAEDIIPTFLWLDKNDRNTIHLFQLVRNPGKCNTPNDKSVCCYDNDD